MRFQTELLPARLIRRYKRFLADVLLDDGREVTAHCPNPGAMTGLADPGTRIWLEPNDDPKKKLKFGWRLAEFEGGNFACIDTGMANRVVAEALKAGQIEALRGFSDVRAEVRYGENSRIDFLLSNETGDQIYVEVKSVTLSRQPGLAEFPDTVTKRGTKHLGELAKVANIDPAYAAATRAAKIAGVEAIACRTHMDSTGIEISGPAEIAPL
jgi:sugar fermentation stimulation protein A